MVSYHRPRILHSKVSEPAARTREDNPLAWPYGTPLACGICSDATTHDWAGLLILDSVRETSGVSPIAQGILLESARDTEARILLIHTMQFIHAICTELTLATRAPNPLDSSTVTDLPLMVHCIAYGNNDTGTLVAGNPFRRRLHINAKVFPFIMNQGFVRRTQASPVFVFRMATLIAKRRWLYQLILTRISSGPGVGTSIVCTGALALGPFPTLTAAF